MTKDFIEAFNSLIGTEGGYVNDGDDIGGETYMGISRRYNPDWKGWDIIDGIKDEMSLGNYFDTDEFKRRVNSSDTLREFAQEFYYQNYWVKFNGDKLPYVVAEELLEQSVVLGTWKTAGINLQKALNLLNRNGKIFKDLIVDGIIGEKTLDAVHKVSPRRLLLVLNGIEFEHFKKSMIDRPKNEKYVGWFDRTYTKI